MTFILDFGSVIAMCIMLSVLVLSTGYVITRTIREKSVARKGEVEQEHQHRIEIMQVEHARDMSVRKADLDAQTAKEGLAIASWREKEEMKLLADHSRHALRSNEPSTLHGMRDRVRGALEGVWESEVRK